MEILIASTVYLGICFVGKILIDIYVAYQQTKEHFEEK